MTIWIWPRMSSRPRKIAARRKPEPLFHSMRISLKVTMTAPAQQSLRCKDPPPQFRWFGRFRCAKSGRPFKASPAHRGTLCRSLVADMSSRVDSIKARVDQKERQQRTNEHEWQCWQRRAEGILNFSRGPVSQERDRVEAPHRRRKVQPVDELASLLDLHLLTCRLCWYCRQPMPSRALRQTLRQPECSLSGTWCAYRGHRMSQAESHEYALV